MGTAIVTVQQGAVMSAADVRAQVNLIQEVMRAVMKSGVHYGTVPGTDKPTLFKPGAEVLCATFRIAPEYTVEDLSTDDSYRYRVLCRGRHQMSGVVLADGMGSASSNEKKYKWRAAVCQEEFDVTPENRRRIEYRKKRDGGFWTVKQIRTDPDDIDNTVLKMACKRAQVAMALNATAASDIFTQDIEDLPPELREHGEDEGEHAQSPRVQMPQSTEGSALPPDNAVRSDGAKKTKDLAATHAVAPPSMIALIKARMHGAALSTEDLRKRFPAVTDPESLDGISVQVGNEVLRWIGNPAEN